MAEQTFFDGVGDAFSTIVGGWVAVEEAKAKVSAAEREQAELDQIVNAPRTTENVNAQPVRPDAVEVTSGSGQGATRRVMVAGMEFDRTALYVAGGALVVGALLLLRK